MSVGHSSIGAGFVVGGEQVVSGRLLVREISSRLLGKQTGAIGPWERVRPHIPKCGFNISMYLVTS